MDSLTILHADKPAAKRIHLDEKGELTVRAIEPSFLHNVETVSVDGLLTLYGLLEDLQVSTSKMVVRGQLIEGRQSQQIRRTLRTSKGEPPNFEACPRQWLMIDIDQLPLPPVWSDIEQHADKIVQYATEQLPTEFQEVSCVYQWSGSMGVKRDQVRLHLWFWLDRPVADHEAKAWLRNSPVDLALYNPVQPHFTANPTLSAGVIDPVKVRVGLYEAKSGEDTVRVPDIIETSATPTTSRRYVSGAGVIDPQEVVRNPDTGLIVDGRERFLLRMSNAARRQLMVGRSSKDLPSVEEIADLTWQLFSDEADLSDGRWTRTHAEAEAERRHGELTEGNYNAKAKSVYTALEPTAGPFADISLVDKAEGQAKLEAALTSFFRCLDQGPRLALRITMGAGKTRATLKHLQAYLADSFGKTVEAYVPRHDLAEQYVRDIQAIGGFATEVIHVKPRTGGGAGIEQSLCLRPQYVRELEVANLGVFKNACRAGDGSVCDQFDTCPYIQQFKVPEPNTANRGNTLRIFVHQYLGLPRNPLQAKPDLVIIDEAFLNEVTDTKTKISAMGVKRHFKTGKHPKLGRVIMDCLEEGEPLLKELREADVSPQDLDEIDLDALKPVVAPDLSGNSAAKLKGDAGLHRSLTRMRRILQEELRLQPPRDDIERIVFDPKDGGVRLAYLKDLWLPETSAVLCLDATADQALLEEVIGPIELVRIDVEQKAVVTQVYNRTGSKSFWKSSAKSVNKLVAAVNTWAEFGETPLVVGDKTLADTLRGRKDLHSDVKVNHFSALRGSNDAENCSVIFITGRNMPPPPEVDLKARAMFWASHEPLLHDDVALLQKGDDEVSLLPVQLKGYIQSDRNPLRQSGVSVPTFCDRRIESIHAQIRDAETMQALGRLRLVHAKYQKRVFLLSNLPVEIPVDHLVRDTELMPDTLELELIKKGNIPLSPLGLLKMRSDIATSRALAEKLLQRSRVREPSRLRSVPELVRSGLFVVEFEAENAGRRNVQRHLFMLQNHTGHRISELSDLLMSTGRIPFDDWVRFLEDGDPEIEGSGWAGVHNPRLRDAWSDNVL